MIFAFLFLGIFISWFLLLAIFSLAKDYRKKSIVIVDFDTLVDIEDIIARGKIFIQNRKDVALSDYIGSHLAEQKVIPRMIKKVLKLQSLGYTIVYTSGLREENTRTITSKVLNEWGLKGDLYLKRYWQKGDHFKYNIIRQFLDNKYNIYGVIDSSRSIRNFCNKRGINIL